MKTRLLTFLTSIVLLISIPHAFASESFYGASSFENTPSELTLGKPTQFEIKFQYTAGPYALSNFSPVIDVTPTSANSMIHIDVEPLEGISRGQIIRIPVTITVNPNIDHEKIFLSIYFTGDHFSSRSDAFYKSAWSDSIIFDIAPKDQVGIFVEYEIIPWDELGYEINNRATIFTKNMVPRSTLEAGQQYFIIQKVDFSNDNFAENSTFSAVVGYAIQKGNQMIPFPRGGNVTDAEHQEFAEKTRKQRIEFSQESEIAKSFEFVIDPENPFYVKSSLVIEESGKYTRQYYKKLKFSPAIISSNMGGLVVLDKFSKAINENGRCKNDGFGYLIKHDYSTAVCVEPETVWKLKGRGWAI
jgi:hypothetical protein